MNTRGLVELIALNIALEYVCIISSDKPSYIYWSYFYSEHTERQVFHHAGLCT